MFVMLGCWRNSLYSGGIYWDQISRPLSGTNAMEGVEKFIQTNGWQMETGSLLFFHLQTKMRPVAGIPWRGLTHKEYLGITCDGILYIPLRGFGPESDGIAYNPKTNLFPSTINGFLPVGGGWYAWKQTATPADEQRY